MAFMDWIPGIATSSLLALGLWLCRNLIVTRLTKSVEHEFNTKLEGVRTDLRLSEERLKAELRQRETEIAALRSGAMSAMASRQIAVDKRRLEAVDQIWEAVIALAPARHISAFMAVVKFEAAAAGAEKDPRMREVFAVIGSGFDLKKLDLSSAQKARPFVDPVVWASYAALAAICVHAVLRWNIIRHGVGAINITDDDAVTKLITAALPYQQKYLDDVGPAGFHWIIDALEARLLQGIQDMLAGVEADRASIEQAAEILRRSEAVMAASTAAAGDAKQ